MNARTVFRLGFLAATIALTSIVFYTWNYYYEVFVAVRGLQLSIKFDIDFINATAANMKAMVSLQNPSSYSFRLREVHETLYQGEDIVLTAYRAPLPDLTAHSNQTIQVVEHLPLDRISSVTQTENLSLYTRV